MEWQNCPFWQTVFDGPQAHGADDGCSALQDIRDGLALAAGRPFASAKPTDIVTARKAMAKVFSMGRSSLVLASNFHGVSNKGPARFLQFSICEQKPDGKNARKTWQFRRQRPARAHARLSVADRFATPLCA